MAGPGERGDGGLVLVPRPRRMELLGDDGAPVGSAVRESVVGRLPLEGYELDVDEAGVTVRHGGDNGRRYALTTLGQIRSQCEERLPRLRIRDWPDFPVRGYLLDVSRNRVPTRQTLERLIEIMALARINQFELYTEHTFAYRDHEVVWRDASPMTPDDVRWLDERCRSAGIDLVANQATFGHMDRWLDHDAYRQRAETPDGFELLPGMLLPPTTLAPTPDNAAFALGLLDELLPNFSGRRVNVNCDEPFELGRGASAAEVATQGRARVYARHVARIARPLVERGYEVRYWADLVRDEPTVTAQLPPEAIAIAWVYEASRPPEEQPRLEPAIADLLVRAGIDIAKLSGFARHLAPLGEGTFPLWVAPGTSSWNSLIGRIDNAMDNLVDAAEHGRAYGAGGYLITDWGDNGHLQPAAVSFGPLLYGGAVSWCLDANRDLDLPAALDRFVFQDSSATLGSILDRLGRLWRATGQQVFNCSPLHAALFPAQMHLVTGRPDAAKVSSVLDELEAAEGAIAAARPGCVDAAAVQRELRLAAHLARHGGWRLLEEAGGVVPDAEERRAGLEAAVAEQSACWLDRSRPGGLERSLDLLRRSVAV